MKAANNFYVYAYFRLDGTPCYVGKGKGERWRHHGKYGRNCHFMNIRAKAKREGFDLPCTKLIEGLTEPEAMQIEADMIRLVGREANGGPLVNLTDGWEGASGYVWTAEQREAHGAKRRGRKHSPEWRAAISKGVKSRGYVPTPEHREKIASAQRGRKPDRGWWSSEDGLAKQRANNPGNTGHRHSEETREKIRVARAKQTNVVTQLHKGHRPSAETRARLSAAITASWAKRKAAMPSDHAAS